VGTSDILLRTGTTRLIDIESRFEYEGDQEIGAGNGATAVIERKNDAQSDAFLTSGGGRGGPVVGNDTVI
jgi:hypothetical protein